MRHTETFNYYNWTVHAWVDSLISPGRKREVQVNFKCPRCDARNAPLTNGQATECVGCGVHLQLFGKGLHATIEVEAENGTG